MGPQSPAASHPVFSAGQKLKSKDLNDFVKFFATADRDTRVFFLGRGIFYGLDVDYDREKKLVTIKPGAGLSSDGDLFAYENIAEFRGVRSIDVELVGRKLQVDALTTEVIAQNKLASLMADQSNIILLYYHETETVEENCMQTSDRSGGTKTITTEAIIISSEILNEATGAWGNKDTDTEMKELADPTINRFGYSTINTGGQARISFEGFKTWPDVVENFNTVCKHGETSIGEAFIAIYKAYAKQLGFDPASNPFDDLEGRLARTREKLYQDKSFGLPYYYDYLKDLIAASREFLDTDIEGSGFSMPNKKAFENYISLGNTDSEVNTIYRMGVYRPPLAYWDTDILEKAKMLLKRMIELAKVDETFSVIDLDKMDSGITASPGLGFELSRRPLPFYVQRRQEFAKKFWNYEAIDRKRTGNILGVQDNKDRDALLRDMDAYTFFKIKGHVGRSHTDALKSLKQLREELHLPFDIRLLVLGSENFDPALVEDMNIYFSDLSLLLQSALADIKCEHLCDDRFEKAVFGTITSDMSAMFEALGVFFKDVPKGDWEKWISDRCSKICGDRESACCPSYLGLLYKLYLEYDQRKEDLESEFVFHLFAKKHPGIEHNAGVYKGGTLFLVCSPKRALNGEENQILKWLREDQQMTFKTRHELFNLLGEMVVVADFCLPYICCSKSPSIKVEFQQPVPVAEFEETDRTEIRDVDTSNLKGYKIILANHSKNAGAYTWELFKSDSSQLNDQTQITNDLKDVSFELLFSDDTQFLIRLSAAQGSTISKKELTVTISDEKSALEKHAEDYRKVLEDMKKLDVDVWRVEWYKDAKTFLTPRPNKKNFDNDFKNLSTLIRTKFEGLPEPRKKLALDVLVQATLFYMDRQILNADAAHPADKNELLVTTVKFLKENYKPALNLVELWKSNEFVTEENRKLVESYEAILAG